MKNTPRYPWPEDLLSPTFLETLPLFKGKEGWVRVRLGVTREPLSDGVRLDIDPPFGVYRIDSTFSLSSLSPRLQLDLAYAFVRKEDSFSDIAAFVDIPFKDGGMGPVLLSKYDPYGGRDENGRRRRR